MMMLCDSTLSDHNLALWVWKEKGEHKTEREWFLI